MTTAPGEHREAYERDGFVVVRGALPAATVAAIAEEYEGLASRPVGPSEEIAGPRIGLWRHVSGGRKREFPLAAARAVSGLIHGPVLAGLARTLVGDAALRLFECIVFDKPRGDSTFLPWHHDCAFYPFEPANQLSFWLPLDPCSVASGAVHFAVGSHRAGRHAAVDLQTGVRRQGDTREAYPADPQARGYGVRAAEMEPGDLVAFHARTWHCSPPNTSDQANRRGLAVRFLVGTTRFAPAPGNAAGFIAHITQAPGEPIEGPSFPLVGSLQG